jgi:tellurite resistance protein TerC
MLSFKMIKRVIIAVVGGTVLLIGIALIVLPGPAVLVIPAGLAILAVEFAWARRWLRKTREWIDAAKSKVQRKGADTDCKTETREPSFCHANESENR